MADSSPVVRECDYLADIPQVAGLFQEYVAWIGLDLAFQGFAAELAALPGCYAPPGGRLIVADHHGLLVGVVGLRRFGAKDGEIKRLFVKPEWRGRGIASALVARILAEAERMDFAGLYLDTLASMTAAIAVYTRFGFAEVPPYYMNPLPDVVYFRRDARK